MRKTILALIILTLGWENTLLFLNISRIYFCFMLEDLVSVPGTELIKTVTVLCSPLSCRSILCHTISSSTGCLRQHICDKSQHSNADRLCQNCFFWFLVTCGSKIMLWEEYNPEENTWGQNGHCV